MKKWLLLVSLALCSGISAAEDFSALNFKFSHAWKDADNVWLWKEKEEISANPVHTFSNFEKEKIWMVTEVNNWLLMERFVAHSREKGKWFTKLVMFSSGERGFFRNSKIFVLKYHCGKYMVNDLFGASYKDLFGKGGVKENYGDKAWENYIEALAKKYKNWEDKYLTADEARDKFRADAEKVCRNSYWWQ